MDEVKKGGGEGVQTEKAVPWALLTLSSSGVWVVELMMMMKKN